MTLTSNKISTASGLSKEWDSLAKCYFKKKEFFLTDYAWYHAFDYEYISVGRNNNFKTTGRSIHCLKD